MSRLLSPSCSLSLSLCLSLAVSLALSCSLPRALLCSLPAAICRPVLVGSLSYRSAPLTVVVILQVAVAAAAVDVGTPMGRLVARLGADLASAPAVAAACVALGTAAPVGARSSANVPVACVYVRLCG